MCFITSHQNIASYDDCILDTWAYTRFFLSYENGLYISKTVYVLSKTNAFTYSIQLNIPKSTWIPLFLVYYTPASQACRYAIRHTVGVEVHISNPLLPLSQLINSNETLRDIFLTQCWGAHTIFKIDLWGFS
jgi:hypothetical protein